MGKASLLKEGDVVTAFRSFDKSHRVLGVVVSVQEDGDFVDLELENGTIETVHAGDCLPAEQKKAKGKKEKEEKD